MEMMDLDEAAAVFDDFSGRLKIGRELVAQFAGMTFKDADLNEHVKSSQDSFEQIYKEVTASSIIILEKMTEQRAHLAMNLSAGAKFRRAQINFTKENRAAYEALKKIKPDAISNSKSSTDLPAQPAPENELSRKIREFKVRHGLVTPSD